MKHPRSFCASVALLLCVAATPASIAAPTLEPQTLTLYLRSPGTQCSPWFLSPEDGPDPGDRSCMPALGAITTEIAQTVSGSSGRVWAPQNWEPVLIDGSRRVKATIAIGSYECDCALNNFGIGKAVLHTTVMGHNDGRVFEMLYGNAEYTVMPGDDPRVFVFEGVALAAFDRTLLTELSLSTNPRGAAVYHGRVELDTPVSKIEIPILVPKE